MTKREILFSLMGPLLFFLVHIFSTLTDMFMGMLGEKSQNCPSLVLQFEIEGISCTGSQLLKGMNPR